MGLPDLARIFLCRFVEPNTVLVVIDTKGRAGPARRPPPASRDCLREESKTCGSLLAKHFIPELPVLTGPVPKRSVPTRLRRVAHSNGRAIRLGIRTAVNAGRRRRATRRSRVGTPHSDAPRVRHATQAKFVVARRPRAWPLLPAPQDLAPRRLRNLEENARLWRRDLPGRLRPTSLRNPARRDVSVILT